MTRWNRGAINRPIAMLALTPCAAIATITGCAPPFEIALSTAPAGHDTVAAWWTLDDPAGIQGPIVGVERATSPGVTRQTVFCERGIRIFEYRNGQLSGASPPLPPRRSVDDDPVLTIAVRHELNAVNGDAAFPTDEADESQSSGAMDESAVAPGCVGYQTHLLATLVQRLRQSKSAKQTDPPAGLNYRKLDLELQHFKHGLSELLALSEVF